MSGEYGNEPQNSEDVDWGWGQRSKQRTPSVSQPTTSAWLPISPPTSPSSASPEWEQPGHTRRPLSPGGAVPVMTDQSPYTRPPADNDIYPGALEHINRLHRQYAEAPRGYEPTHALPDHTLSGEVHVSSGDEHSGWLGGLVPTRTGAAVLRRKTERDVAKLYDLGFDLRVDPSGQIGETGQVFVGVYTAQITDTQRTDQGKYLRDVRPGQPFAAKYAQLATDTEPYDYLCHVVEKAVMKALSHPNIMAYRVVINLGQRAILRNVSGSEAPDHAGYRRVFLIMDYADHGTLFRFAQKGKLYDRLAVQFTGELCSAIDYMHAKGVAHNDLHHKNILVFNAQGGEYTIKLTDFGMSISSAIYGELGVEVSAGDIQEMIENDLSELKGMLNFMIGKCSGNVLNEGIDLTQVSQLSNELSRTREPLLDVLKRYSFA